VKYNVENFDLKVCMGEQMVAHPKSYIVSSDSLTRMHAAQSYWPTRLGKTLKDLAVKAVKADSRLEGSEALR
jgi:hypothetical protein